MEKAGIVTVGDLHALKEGGLFKVRNLGKKGIAELKRQLDKVVVADN